VDISASGTVSYETKEMPFEKIIVVPDPATSSSLVPTLTTLVLAHCPTFVGIDSASDSKGIADKIKIAVTITNVDFLIVTILLFLATLDNKFSIPTDGCPSTSIENVSPLAFMIGGRISAPARNILKNHWISTP
jgi:hypothetical protein